MLIFVFIFIFVVLILLLLLPLLLVILVILVIFTFFLVFPLVSLAASVSLIGINVFLYVIFAPLSVGSLRLNIGMVVVFLFLVDTAATRRLLQSV